MASLDGPGFLFSSNNNNNNNFEFYCFCRSTVCHCASLLTSSQSFVGVTLQSPRSLHPSILVLLGEFG